jgi:hypothetical protein
MYHTSLKINSDYFPEQLYPVDFHNESFFVKPWNGTLRVIYMSRMFQTLDEFMYV